MNFGVGRRAPRSVLNPIGSGSASVAGRWSGSLSTLEANRNASLVVLSDGSRPSVPNWSRKCGVVAGRSTWPAPDCCKRRRRSWRTGRRTGRRSTPSGWCRSASCWASRCPPSATASKPIYKENMTFTITLEISRNNGIRVRSLSLVSLFVFESPHVLLISRSQLVHTISNYFLKKCSKPLCGHTPSTNHLLS